MLPSADRANALRFFPSFGQSGRVTGRLDLSKTLKDKSLSILRTFFIWRYCEKFHNLFCHLFLRGKQMAPNPLFLPHEQNRKPARLSRLYANQHCNTSPFWWLTQLPGFVFIPQERNIV